MESWCKVLWSLSTSFQLKVGPQKLIFGTSEVSRAVIFLSCSCFKHFQGLFHGWTPLVLFFWGEGRWLKPHQHGCHAALRHLNQPHWCHGRCCQGRFSAPKILRQRSWEANSLSDNSFIINIWNLRDDRNEDTQTWMSRISWSQFIIHPEVLNFTFFPWSGHRWSFAIHPIIEAGIHLRAGMHCNPGAASSKLGLPPEAIAQLAQESELRWAAELCIQRRHLKEGLVNQEKWGTSIYIRYLYRNLSWSNLMVPFRTSKIISAHSWSFLWLGYSGEYSGQK